MYMPRITLPKLFNQLDPAWKNDQHGTSSSTIGKTGCTISLLAAILCHAGYNETPKTVDDKLAKNGGYKDGNLIIWTVVPKLWPKLKWTYRYYAYDNTKAAEWISKGMVPMIEVKADPIGGAPGGKHWVGFIGDRASYDPWGGDIEETKVWTPTGMALFEYTPNPINSNEPSEGGNMGELPANYPDIIKKSGNWDTVVREVLGINDRDPKDVSVDELKAKVNEWKNQVKTVEVIKEVPVEKIVEKPVEVIKEVKVEVPVDGPRQVNLYELVVKLAEHLKNVNITV